MFHSAGEYSPAAYIIYIMRIFGRGVLPSHASRGCWSQRPATFAAFVAFVFAFAFAASLRGPVDVAVVPLLVVASTASFLRLDKDSGEGVGYMLNALHAEFTQHHLLEILSHVGARMVR